MHLLLCEIAWPEWLLGNPWPAAVVLLLSFAGLRLFGRRFEKPPLLRASWVFLALGLLVVGLAQVIETTNRKLDRLTREVVAACVGPNFKEFDRLTTPDVKVTVKDASTVRFQGPAVHTALKWAQVSAAKGSDIEVVERTGDHAVVTLSIAASGRWDGVQTSAWRLSWRKQGDQWLLEEWRLTNMPGGPGMLDHANMKQI